MTAVAAARGAEELGDLPALTDGFSAALLGAAGIALAGAVLAALTLHTPHSPSVQADGELADPVAGQP